MGPKLDSGPHSGLYLYLSIYISIYLWTRCYNKIVALEQKHTTETHYVIEELRVIRDE